MKKFTVLFIVLALVFAFSNTYAQPKLLIHLTGGYNLPLGQLSGDLADILGSSTPNFGDPPKYFQKQGFNFGADFKYAFVSKKSFMLKGALSFSYNMFSNSYDVTTPTAYTYKTKMNVITIGIGPELSFLPKGKASPFIGADFTVNMFSGDASNDGTTTKTWKSATRMGIGANFGVDYKFSKQIGAVLGARFNYLNLIGKKTPTDEVPASGEISLNDKEDATAGNVHAARNMMSLDVYAGITFFLMQPKVVVKK